MGGWAALAAGHARCAVGASAHLRYIADTTVGLSPMQVSRKLDWLATHLTPLVERAGGPRGIGIAAVADVERYVTASGAQAARLFALRHDAHLRIGAEPWGFATSPFEQQRLRDGRLDPVGAAGRRRRGRVGGPAEGALTELLLADGFAVEAHEPVVEWQRRFEDRSRGRVGLTTGARTLQRLAAEGGPKADAYLLVWMLEYVADLTAIDRLATDTLFVSMSPHAVRTRILPWLDGNPGWERAGLVQLIAPRFELVVDGLAYQRKLGSTGVLVRRR